MIATSILVAPQVGAAADRDGRYETLRLATNIELRARCKLTRPGGRERGRPATSNNSVMWLLHDTRPAAIRLAIGAAAVILTACGSSTTTSPTAPSANIFHAEVLDSVGDAVAPPGVANAPDLVHGTADVSSGNIVFTIQFAPGTLNLQSTRVTVELDTDQDLSTGNRVAGPLGVDYSLDFVRGRSDDNLARHAVDKFERRPVLHDGRHCAAHSRHRHDDGDGTAGDSRKRQWTHEFPSGQLRIPVTRDADAVGGLDA